MGPSRRLSVKDGSSVPLMSLAPASPLDTTGKAISGMTTTTVGIEGMTCGACTSAIEGAFRDLEGVASLSVSLMMNRAVIVHDAKLLPTDTIVETIEDKGFDASIISTVGPMKSSQPTAATTTIGIEGMTCGACTSSVEGAFEGVAGVISVTVSLMMNRAVIIHEPELISAAELAEKIEDKGFDATVISSEGAKKKSSYATTTIDIEGMTCGSCTSSVEGAFDGVEGIGSVSVSLVMNRAVIVHDSKIISADAVAQIIEDKGFDATVVSSDMEKDEGEDETLSVILKIFGLVDEGSVQDVERVLQAVPGVVSAVLVFSTAKATVGYSKSTGLRTIVEAVESAGYNALVSDNDDANAQLESLAKTKEIQEWKRAFQFSLSFAIPVFLISMIIPMYLNPIDIGNWNVIFPGLYLGDLACLVLTIPVQFGVGHRFYVSAWKAVKHGSATMDVLVVLGTSAAFFFSIIAMVISVLAEPHSRPATVFDTCTMLITFITLGRYLENKAKGQTSKALSRLMSLAPSMARIYVNPDRFESKSHADKDDIPITPAPHEERTIPTELIQVGDIVILRPGDKIPADGVVVAGESYIDESMVTGEAMPIYKAKGANLIGGTVNGAGKLDFKVTRAGRDTQLSQIVKLVQEAQTSRAPIQRMADIVAGYFVPGVVSLGVVTFIGWMILSHVLPHPPMIFNGDHSGGKFMVCMKLCISVIVFACPCALGLSTPTAVMVGTGVGAENGILVKGGEALETATKITKVILDKTGTITVGRMSVARSAQSAPWSSSDWRTQRWWTLVGLAEQGSEHPVGRAIANGAKAANGLSEEQSLNGTISDFKVVVGRGIKATVAPAGGKDLKAYRVLIGNAAFLRENSVELSVEAERDASSRGTSPSQKQSGGKASGRTFVFVAIDELYAGYISLSDPIKEDAKYMINALRRLGKTVAMVTGDQRSTALEVAREVGIEEDQVWAGVSPDEKQHIVATMKSEGEVVAMVGDGINDSPALATADIGIAISSGTDVAMEAADIVLMRPQCLLDIPAAFHLASSIFSRIKLNLFWACGYNVIGMPFAMGFFLPFGLHLHPMAAGAAMACSSVSVVCSSLLLKFWTRPKWMTIEGMERDNLRMKSRGGARWWSPKSWSLFAERKTKMEGYAPVSTSDVV